jgi:hypothetical protein
MVPRRNSKTLEESISLIRELFFAPRLFVNIGKRDFAIARIDAVDSRLTLPIEITLGGGTVRKLDLILLAGDGLAGFIEKFDFDPVTGWSGRTCRAG